MLKNISELARLSGLDRATVRRRLQGLSPTKEGKALLYPVTEALRLLLLAGTETDTPLDPRAEQAALHRARRQMIELEKAQREGQLLDREDVRSEWLKRIGIARSRLLSVPSRTAHQVVGKSDERQIENIIRTEIYQALSDLAQPDANAA
jgi:phage terminase Nu1 subunit (DNA packaging protein)